MSPAETAAATAARTAAKFAPPRPPTRAPQARTPQDVPDVDDPQVSDLVLRKAPDDTDKTRSTVDLWPAEHDATNQLQRDIAFTLGVKSHRVSRDMTLRLLLKLARTDETTTRKLLALMRDEFEGRKGES